MTVSKEEMLAQPSLYLPQILADPELFAELQKMSEETQKKMRDVKPWDVINSNVPKATVEEAERRYSICLGCPELLKVTKQCKQCGCFMKLKVKIEGSSCPLEKW